MKKLLICILLSVAVISCDDGGTDNNCGNGTIDIGEECDPAAGVMPSCAEEGYYGNSLTLCSDSCKIDYSQCEGICGDGIIQGSEECDTNNLGDSPVCGDHTGYTGDAQVSCGSSCRYDLSMCEKVCGNGEIDEGEECDGEDLGGKTNCGMFDGFNVGEHVGCTDSCKYDLSECVLISCGNGVVEEGEDCEIGNLGDNTCLSEGYYSGMLKCTNCHLDISGCVGICGDGEIQSTYSEECDGLNLSNKTCGDLGYHGGELGCNSVCKFDLSDCMSEGICGDGVVQVSYNEECDNTDFQGQTCGDFGYHGGDLICNSCEIDLSNCVEEGRCGDGILQTSYEECEGTNLNGTSCMDLGFYTGNLGCNEDCSFDESNCEGIGYCGDGDIQTSYEECDLSNMGGMNCSDFGYFNGNLACSGSCTLEYNGCNYLLTMIDVNGGSFQRDSEPANVSVVSAFKISETEITREQFSFIFGTDPSNTSVSNGITDPVQMVNWYHAIAFCNKLSIHEGLTPVYSISGVDFSTLTYGDIPTTSNSTWNAVSANWNADGYRLPTEMEWIWAALGEEDDIFKPFAGYDGTNSIGDYAVYNMNSEYKTASVKSKLPNQIGIYDMSGNIMEFIWDYHATYPSGTLNDYRGPVSGYYRKVKGGPYDNDANMCAPAHQFYVTPETKYNSMGFRVAKY
ncbi:MAG: SUMF1/EgtB/PvdO family nonheme iron enzyme [Deltaproteobacteria bacterium]|nr:SUMF1/EgtB/PvdO family nonheme iron enzyme [Deltaproteobacteria bacterium]